MKNYETLSTLIDHMMLSYPRQEIEPGTVRIYSKLLEDIPSAVLAASVHRAISRCKFWPTIAEIRAIAAEIATSLPQEEEAMAELASGKAWRKESHPLIRGAARAAIGTRYDWDHSTSPSVLRSQYREQYRLMRASAISAAIAPGGMAELAPPAESTPKAIGEGLGRTW